MVFGEGEEIKIDEATFIVHKAPATVAYDFAIKYRLALEKQDAEELTKCNYMLLKYVEVVLDDGRKVALDNKGIIDQHIKSATALLELQQKAVSINFGSSSPENH